MANRSDLGAQVQQAAAEAVGAKAADKATARRVEALNLRLAGLSFSAIGDRLGISERAAYEMVNRSLERAEAYGVQQMRAEENARLDRITTAIWGQVLQGDLKAIATYLSVSAQRSRINGLYAPTQVQMSLSIRQEMQDALDSLESMVLVTHENPNRAHDMKVLEGRDVTDYGGDASTES